MSPPAAEIVLETRDLGMRFGGVTALDRVDFVLRAGELRCLIGPNGAGKSTFFKCLTGQLKPGTGTVWVRERNITGLLPHAIARLGVGIKTQVPSVFEGLSVHENIWLAARRSHSKKQAAVLTEETLTRLQLDTVAYQNVNQLAHGQRQWVELGIVLAAQPWLMLLDEPAAGMTAEEVARTAQLIRAINQTITLIVIDHDMAFIRMIADTVTVFNQGAILLEDHVDKVLADQRVRDIYLGKKVK
jgi:ABC-type uncharacterized transport system ATPase subunit